MVRVVVMGLDGSIDDGVAKTSERVFELLVPNVCDERRCINELRCWVASTPTYWMDWPQIHTSLRWVIDRGNTTSTP